MVEAIATMLFFLGNIFLLKLLLTTRGDLNNSVGEILKLRTKIRHMEFDNTGLRVENAELRANLRYINKIINSRNDLPTFLTDSHKLKWLISCTHPDKHNGSAISNEITAELLKLR